MSCQTQTPLGGLHNQPIRLSTHANTTAFKIDILYVNLELTSILLRLKVTDVGSLQSLTQPLILVLLISPTFVETCDIMVFSIVDLIYGLQ